MNADQFVASWRKEKDALLTQFTDRASGSEVARLILVAQLTEQQNELLRKALDTALSDALYTLPLGLDGSASIGGVQGAYQLRNADGKLVAEPGKLEAPAWKYFHERRGQTTGPSRRPSLRSARA